MIKKLLLICLLLMHFSLLYGQSDSVEITIIYDEHAHPLFLKGKSAGEEGNYEKACKYILEAITIDSLTAEYYEMLAINAEKLGDLNLLNQCYQQASRLFETDYQIQYVHANSYQNLHKYEKALALYDKALALTEGEELPDLYLYYFNRGNTYLKMKQHQLAKADYDTALKLNPKHQAALINRGTVRYQLKDKKGACSDWYDATQIGYCVANRYYDKYCH